MSNDKGNGKHDDNLVKKTSKEATDLFGNVVDTSGKIVKSVSGEGGLVGKVTDASGRVLKGAAQKANDVVGKTSEAPGKIYRNAKGHLKHKNSSGSSGKKE
ncbi:hypothetical protein P5G51_002785 [Virgibacillus sp. 179-BFC.A HS]|uniref:CsbD family protein n=1 Tax=Tigheibacillus jepli TaxID=3035914 RepID=A0ABU5CDR5_9BACI|nr:hypothetical protein [Virgibacillus sp. 179-BFC.A HS]MDY0404478.1 hypothetical protein [Virgibacillus sp. 179-BFC.A HS]